MSRKKTAPKANLCECGAELPPRFKKCAPCMKEYKKQRAAIDSAKVSAKRKCRCGCGKPPAKGAWYAKECKPPRKQKGQYCSKKEDVVLPTSYKPSRIVMTSEQIDAECRAEERKLAERRPLLDQRLLAVRTMPVWMRDVVFA